MIPSTMVCSPAPRGAGEHPRLRRLASSVLALLAAALIVLAAPASPAFAHAQLVSASPGNGERLSSAPAQIVLRFSERVDLVGEGVQLLGPGGRVAGREAVQVDPGAPGQVRMALPATLADGVYTVSWRVVSADSHPIHGAFVFAVGDVALGALPDAGAQTDADPVLTAAFWLFRWLGYAGLALLSGGVCFLLLCWRTGWTQDRARRVVTAGWILSAMCATAVLLLQGPYAAGGSLTDAGDASLLTATLNTDYGQYMLVRLGLLLLAGGLLVAAARWRDRVFARPWGMAGAVTLACVGGVGLPITWVGTGHANAQASILSAGVDATHLSAMAIWFGGLVVLLSCVLPASAQRPLPEVAGAVSRFSRVATICVTVLVLTGIYQAWRGVGSIEAVSGSTYGALLVFKLAVVGVLLWFGAMSRSLVRRRYVLPAMQEPDDAVAPPANRSARRSARARQHHDVETRKRLRWSVRTEAVVGLAVLALTAMLVATPPAARPAAGGAAAAAPNVVSAQLALDGGEIHVRLDPARRGPNSLTLTVRQTDGNAWDVPEVTAALLLPEQDLGPLPVTLTQSAPGEYRSAEVNVPMPGRWRLELEVRTSEIDQTDVWTDIVVN